MKILFFPLFGLRFALSDALIDMSCYAVHYYRRPRKQK